MVSRLSSLSSCLMQKTEVLNTALLNSKNHTEVQDSANYYKDTVLTAMQELRAVADELETLTGSSYWPYPTFGDLLFRV